MVHSINDSIVMFIVPIHLPKVLVGFTKVSGLIVIGRNIGIRQCIAENQSQSDKHLYLLLSRMKCPNNISNLFYYVNRIVDHISFLSYL